MTRPIRIEFAGALYHVTSRGDRREDIYLDDGDRSKWVETLGEVCQRFNWVVHAYCEMTNHYHLLIETPDGNLSMGMRQLNGVYTQHINRRHRLAGHLFQGRYKAILVQKETYLLELTRYVVLNPVRARMVKRIADWPWSSYPAMAGLCDCPDWLDSEWLLTQFGVTRGEAIAGYQRFVADGIGKESPLAKVRHQLLLGSDSFVEKNRAILGHEPLREVSKAQRRSQALSLDEYQRQYPSRTEAMARAYLSGAYTMKEIGL